MDDKTLVVDIIREKTKKLQEFESLTKSYIEQINESDDDIRKAEKFSSMVDLREVIVNEILALQQRIDKNENLSEIYESDDLSISIEKKCYKDKLEELKQLQIEVNELSDKINEEMRTEFKKLKDAQKFNTKYFDHGDVLGAKYNFNS